MGDPKPSFGAVRAESLPDVVRRELETAIEEERLLPGDRLPSERELAEQFDVSRIVVREALRGLEATNTIEIQRNRGAFVRRRPSQGVREQWAAWLAEHNVEVVEILRIRRALEALAAGEAARQARRADVADLRRLCKAFDRELASGDPDVARLVELDIEFHRLIGRPAAAHSCRTSSTSSSACCATPGDVLGARAGRGHGGRPPRDSRRGRTSRPGRRHRRDGDAPRPRDRDRPVAHEEHAATRLTRAGGRQASRRATTAAAFRPDAPQMLAPG